MKPWHEEARQLRAEGLKLSDIAERFNVTVGWAHVVTRGVVCPVNHMANGLMALQRWREAGGRCKNQWTQDQDDYVRANYKQGKSAAQIGAVLGFTRDAVIGRAGRLGLFG